jgi:hypothetical protein
VRQRLSLWQRYALFWLMKGQSSRGMVFDWFESLELEPINRYLRLIMAFNGEGPPFKP